MDRHIIAFLEHLAGERGLSENTIDAYRTDLTGLVDFAADPKSQKPISIDWNQFDEERVAKYVSSLDDRGYSNSTRSRKIASLKSFMRFLRAEGITDATQNHPPNSEIEP